jgi:4-nitrophenyl phosphatase
MLTNIRNLVLDMDGVLWRGDTPMPGLVNFIETLHELEIGFVLATNNARKTAVEFTEKLAKMGVKIPATQILTSAEITAIYLRGSYAPGTFVYVIGDKGLHEAMKEKEFVIVGPDDVEKGASASIVVVGFTPYAQYHELAMGSLLVHQGAAFYGTNPDPSIPTELGPLPGAGALLAVISTATGIEPVTIGKPGPCVFEEALRRLGSSKEDTAMVGDRLSTDIAGAKSAGLWAIMLLSGISTREDVQESVIKPDYIFADIEELTLKLKT